MLISVPNRTAAGTATRLSIAAFGSSWLQKGLTFKRNQKDEGHDAAGTDAAVLQDFQHPFPAAAGKKAVGRIHIAIGMETARQIEPKGHDQDGAAKRIKDKGKSAVQRR